MRSKQFYYAALALAFYLSPSRTDAQVQIIDSEADSTTAQPTIYKMTVSPAAEPRPALKYHFLVPPVDKTPGNAATFYYKAMVIEGPDWISQIGDDEKLDEW